MARFVQRFLEIAVLIVGLIAGAQAAPPDMTPGPPIPTNVVISPGDVIVITVVGEPDLSRRVVVTDDGKVPVAFVGEVKVAGMRPAEAAAAIRTALSRFLRKPEVTVDLVDANRGSVFGRVVHPGTYVLPPRARAMDLIQMAGGFEENADRARVRLLRQGKASVIDLAAFAATGDVHHNPELRAGDVLSVPERASLSVAVLGQVLRPGTLAVPVDARVMDAVQMAGGFTERANRERVVILRAGAQIPVNLMQFQATGDVTHNPILMAGDTVTVPEKRMLSVTVLGQVLKPSVYQVPEGTTVAEVIALAGGIVEGADLSLARLTHRDRTAEPLNLKEALERADSSANVPLQDGDTVSLPKPVVERRFGVLGAVRAGGYFTMENDRVTITEALARAGGPLPDANLKTAAIIRRDGDRVVRIPVNLLRVLKAEPQGSVATLGPGDVLYVDVKKESVASSGNIAALLGVITALIYTFGR